LISLQANYIAKNNKLEERFDSLVRTIQKLELPAEAPVPLIDSTKVDSVPKKGK
jgi:hypothetical protein